MKKIVTIALCFSLMMLTVSTTSFASEKNNSVNGISLNKNDAINFIASGASNSLFNFQRITNLSLTNSMVTSDMIEMNGHIEQDKEVTPFVLKGNLLIGSQQSHGINTFVGKLEDSLNNFEVLYFYIKNDERRTGYIFNDELKEEKMFALYLKNNHTNEIIFFEDRLDTLNIDTSNIHASQKASPKDDLLWISKVLPSNLKK
ncbi:hypothetical protein M6D81_31455 [Paenibacillus sp. J5C_2022]|uniref:hypothetical protein n=1 Tax=Paenibacillus sp. J5C2022 TaxID=2977129 RepID=UPI0021D0DF11|nr:hypothetical protein [Paenibacillus sp. J5C2022]MCU6713224.1 hypothetical protein [Paenibacillus sp. J5C2022]